MASMMAVSRVLTKRVLMSAHLPAVATRRGNDNDGLHDELEIAVDIVESQNVCENTHAERADDGATDGASSAGEVRSADHYSGDRSSS